MRQIYPIPEFYDAVGYQWLECDEGNRTSRELAIINKEFTTPSFLIEAGCGYGRIAIPLANKGHQVYAFDSSFEMIQELCNRSVKNLQLKNNLLISKENLEQPKELPAKTDGVLLMWGTFANIDKVHQLSALKTFRKTLDKKGKILVELPRIDNKSYQEMTGADIEVLEEKNNYGISFIYWDQDKGIVFNVPNEKGIKALAAKAGLELKKTYAFKVNVQKNIEERIVYVLANQRK